MVESDVDKSLLLFRRQYLQLFEPDFLAWPPQKLLRAADAQVWLYRRLFDEGRTPYLPPGGYQLRVLKGLIARIKKASGNEEGEVRKRHPDFLNYESTVFFLLFWKGGGVFYRKTRCPHCKLIINPIPRMFRKTFYRM